MRAAAKPGVAIAVVRGDSVVYLDAEGRVEYSEIAAAVSAEDTLFMTASITKPSLQQS
jgi:CubicO group peptidase (beta-lactamase class C family)